MLKKRILSIVLALTMLMVPGAYAAQPAKDDMRGVWVASVHNIDFPSEQGMTADKLKVEADTELDNIAAMGLNTVFLQVRSSADALYPSELFPWSRYVSGTAGQAPDGSFDVLGYWVTAAHERGLQLHAWINPYRITIDGEDERNPGFQSGQAAPGVGSQVQRQLLLRSRYSGGAAACRRRCG